MLQAELQGSAMLPVRSLYSHWLETGEIAIAEIQKQQKRVAPHPCLVSQVDIQSDFFGDLVRILDQTELSYDLIIPWHNLEFILLSQRSINGRWVVLLDRFPTPLELEKLRGWSRQQRDWRLLIVARKDWDFFSVYRSLPYWCRSFLRVDFPLQVFADDPLWDKTEVLAWQDKMADMFAERPLPYCDQEILFEPLMGTASSSHSLWEKRWQRINRGELTFVKTAKKEEETLAASDSQSFKQKVQNLFWVWRQGSKDLRIWPEFVSHKVKVFWYRIRWRLKPQSYPILWRLRHYYRCAFLPSIHRSFRFAFYPLFKTYYFLNYQYHKRITGRQVSG